MYRQLSEDSQTIIKVYWDLTAYLDQKTKTVFKQNTEFFTLLGKTLVIQWFIQTSLYTKTTRVCIKLKNPTTTQIILENSYDHAAVCFSISDQ